MSVLLAFFLVVPCIVFFCKWEGSATEVDMSVILSLCVVLLCIVFFWKREKNKSTEQKTKLNTSQKAIPGPEKGTKEFSNFLHEDIGSQIEFIQRLHKRYGPIAWFYDGDQLSVSIATPELLKETRHLSAMPESNMEPFRNLSSESFPFQSSEVILERRKLYDQQLSMKAVKTHFDILKNAAEEVVSEWENKDQILLFDVAINATMKANLVAIFGETFADDKKLQSFKTEYELISKKMGLRLNSEDSEAFNAGLNKLKGIVKVAYEDRRKQLQNGSETHFLIDVLLEDHISENQRDADALSFFLAAGSSNIFLNQLLYYLIDCPEYQDKVYEELKTVLGDDSVTLDNYSRLIYLRQVINECLRFGITFHTARKAEKDMTIGGYFIPEGTPIYQNIGACHRNPNQWKSPDKFNPDNFSREASKGRHSFAFKPFGFAGKRTCPGMNFALMLMIIFSAVWLKKYKFTLAPGEKFVFIHRPGANNWVEETVQISISPRN